MNVSADTRFGSPRRTPAADRRTRSITFRCSESEGDLIDQAAFTAGVSLSDLVRDAAVLYARPSAID